MTPSILIDVTQRQGAQHSFTFFETKKFIGLPTFFCRPLIFEIYGRLLRWKILRDWFGRREGPTTNSTEMMEKKLKLGMSFF